MSSTNIKNKITTQKDTTKKRKNCPKGTRRNKQGDCVPNQKLVFEETKENIDLSGEKSVDLKTEYENANCQTIYSVENKTCNKFLLKKELLERKELETNPDDYSFLYPTLNDPYFNIKIAEKKEFQDTKYDGEIYTDIEKRAEYLSRAEFELAPHQAFVRNFLSFQTPYNSLLLYHGLGSGKTCSAIGVCEEMRDYLNQIGKPKKIIIVASPNVQENFRLQLFDERKLKLVDGLWNIRACTGNKLIKEINPMNMKGFDRKKVISMIQKIINGSYKFIGYIGFANWIKSEGNITGEYKNEKDRAAREANALKRIFNDSMIVIDEVHNIRIAEDNDKKIVAEQLMRLVQIADNMRLLLLSATPMYNSYKEIVWLLNLMNINDRRGVVEVDEIFDKNGAFLKNERGEETGKEMLIRKATGYVSFVRGDNPYTFPFRVYPSDFAPEHSFNYQFPNGKYAYPMGSTVSANRDERINILNLYLLEIGNYQAMGYKYIMDNIYKKRVSVMTDKGVINDIPTIDLMGSLNYSVMQLPLEALIIVYPMDNLEEVIDNKNATSAPISIVPKLSDEPEVEPVKYEPVTVPGKNSLYINANDLTGSAGLKRVMNFEDNADFEYNDMILRKYGRIFSKDEIGKYSSKIKNICDCVIQSEGVVLIFSQYIPGGLIPVALALEELGFTRFGENAKPFFKTPPTELLDSRTMKPKSAVKREDFIPARYAMITGDVKISPNNSFELKTITNEENKYGKNVKVVLISKAGSEGLDFKFLRQVHILEPWYNMNRNEQIIGRAVRNGSHIDLPFTKRNVQIYMYATMLENPQEESVDLYVYRGAEFKSIQIGRVSRVLKETAVDCVINHDQTNYSQDAMGIEVEQVLSDGTILPKFKVGDAPYSANCDYMENCDYLCGNGGKERKLNITEDSYNESFILMNSDKIIQKIKILMRERFFYKKNELIYYINTPKPFPLVQIYAALTTLVENRNEFIVDKYKRTGYLVNIGEYYLFQPSELNNEHSSVFERITPIDYKRASLQFELNPDVLKKKSKQRVYKKKTVEEMEEEGETKTFIKTRHVVRNYELVNDLKKLFDTAIEYARVGEKVERGDNDWYKHCGVVMKKMGDEKVSGELLLSLLIAHIVDTLMYHDKVELLNHLYSIETINEQTFEGRMKTYFDSKVIRTKRGVTGMILYDTTPKKERKTVYLNEENTWVPVQRLEDLELMEEAVRLYEPSQATFDELVGYIGLEKNNKYLIFKVKNTKNARNTGARCDESSKTSRIDILNKLAGFEKYTKENTKGIVQPELCALQEFLFRLKQRTYNETSSHQKAFLDFDGAVFYRFFGEKE
jgi:Helicase conserved C-terminal domain